MKPIPQAAQIKRPTLQKQKEFHHHAQAKRVEPQTAVPQIELFQRESCPFSHVVRSRLSELGLDFVARTVPPPGSPTASLKHQQLLRTGGRDQIPYLVDHHSGAHLYESDAILSYLEHEYGPPESSPLVGFVQRASSRIIARIDRYSWMIQSPLERAAELIRDGRKSADELRGMLRNGLERIRAGVL